MQIVIAGGHGQVAMLLHPLLTERGHDVRGIIRNAQHFDAVRQAGAEPVLCDLEADEDVRQFVVTPDNLYAVFTTVGRVGEGESLLYIRRPTRAAETAISGIVLARGTDLPAPPTTTDPTPSDGDALVQDEDSVFLNRVNLEGLAVQRPAAEGDAADALADLGTEFGTDATVVQRCLNVLLRVERRYDGVIWQTLLALARSENLAGFHQALLDQQNEFASTGALVLDIGSGFGLASLFP